MKKAKSIPTGGAMFSALYATRHCGPSIVKKGVSVLVSRLPEKVSTNLQEPLSAVAVPVVVPVVPVLLVRVVVSVVAVVDPAVVLVVPVAAPVVVPVVVSVVVVPVVVAVPPPVHSSTGRPSAVLGLLVGIHGTVWAGMCEIWATNFLRKRLL